MNSKLITNTSLINLSCSDMTFGVYNDNQGNSNSILFIKDNEKNINSFSNTIAIKFKLIDVLSVKMVSITVEIWNKNNKDYSFVYMVQLNYCTEIGSKFLNAILRNPVITVSFINENTKSLNGIQTKINQNVGITYIMMKLNDIAP